ncbi:hypothetical protein E5161_00580 [Cohnella pontilimi]|uniref:Glycosyltransferase RgtA/B/C/D-like domain-containing protein n=1 Tax=Cohnella pontilimi TaxID=2564100 RepID=A0A4U0FHM1_9BACL|nr:YfhO family protein [Cohnella pontilimi]TJY43934.1 hypothetical protein E5161_00580 [Cohnella pontilimi]
MKNNRLSILLGCIVTLCVMLMFPRFSYNDPDTFWHIELGRYMIDHGTVLHHAIHTFYNDRLPYVPHEFGFQLVIAALYRSFGLPGTYILTAVCLFLLILGLDRLTRVSRKELGLEERRPILLLLVMAVSCWIYYSYFTTRPQMVSSWMIVWFVVCLREFQISSQRKYAVWMTVLSLAISNFHAGVWLVPAVFTGMAVLESLTEKRLSPRRAAAYFAIWLAGLLNPGGIRSIFYILTVTKGNFNMLINEWQPIEFSKLSNFPILLIVLFFAAILPFALHRKPFRFMFMLGILYLGISSYKQNLFLWLFIPYFVATLVERVPWIRNLRIRFERRHLLLSLAAGLIFNVGYNFTFPAQVDTHQYPVEEMNYILRKTPPGMRPKVLAPYGSSGYVMYRGANVLCDGRQDPFVTTESKGALGWTAFERSMYGFSEYLPEIVAYDKPDYVIARNNVSYKLMQEWSKQFGAPVFKGRYGSVFVIRKS